MSDAKPAFTIRDLPKVKGKPKPEEPLYWTVQDMGGAMYAFLHTADKKYLWHGRINNPENFLNLLEKYRPKP